MTKSYGEIPSMLAMLIPCSPIPSYLRRKPDVRIHNVLLSDHKKPEASGENDRSSRDLGDGTLEARRDSDELGFDGNEIEYPGWLELRCGIARKNFSMIDIQFRGWLTDCEVEFGEVDPKNVRAGRRFKIINEVLLIGHRPPQCRCYIWRTRVRDAHGHRGIPHDAKHRSDRIDHIRRFGQLVEII
jgi:hypothetical protein